jgi:transglutaminase-like putative cysteine protease
MNAVRLRTVAEHFRSAIESTPPGARPAGLRDFPRGSCSDASLLFATYLKDCGLPPCRYVSAERGDRAAGTWTSHAWLVYGPWQVDITADQFADAPAGVIVERNSRWHEQFEIQEVRSADLRDWSGPGVEPLELFYRTVVAEMEPDRPNA